jgi:hypothetical protein
LSKYLEQANLLPSDSTEHKILKLSKVILDRLDDTRGTPDRSWYQVGEFQQFQQIWNKELSGIYCTQFRHVYTSLANEAGIPTRVIHSRVTTGQKTRQMKRGPGVSDHNFSESYIAETGDWALVDLDSKVVLIRDDHGQFVNTIDLYDIFVGRRRGSNFELSGYDSSIHAIQKSQFKNAGDLADFLSKNTKFPLFFQKNQTYLYERIGRSHFFYRPYPAPETDLLIRKRFFALAGIGGLLALAVLFLYLQPLQGRTPDR